VGVAQVQDGELALAGLLDLAQAGEGVGERAALRVQDGDLARDAGVARGVVEGGLRDGIGL
jgi:hypothetical protein